MSTNRLFQMAAAADAQLHQFYSNTEDERSNIRTVAGGVAGAGAVAGGAYGATKMRQAVINKAGATDDYGNLVARRGMYGDAAKAYGADAKLAAQAAARKGLKKTAGLAGQASNTLYKKAIAAGVPYSATPGAAGLLRKGQGKASSLLQGVSKKLRTVARAFTVGDVERIVSLAARIEGLREFGEPEQQRGKVGMYLTGGVPSLIEQSRYKDSGLAYRKRDALKDNFKGGLAATGGTAALVGGAVGLANLAGKRKVPKGMLRNAAVKGSQFMKKNKMGTYYTAALAGTAGGLAVAHGSAEKRRKALLAQRLEGAGA